MKPVSIFYQIQICLLILLNLAVDVIAIGMLVSVPVLIYYGLSVACPDTAIFYYCGK